MLSLLTREILEKAYPRKLARRKAQLSPEEIQALTDEKRTSGTTTSGTTTQQAADPIEPIAQMVCTWIIVFLAIVSEHLQTVVLSMDNNYLREGNAQMSNCTCKLMLGDKLTLTALK